MKEIEKISMAGSVISFLAGSLILKLNGISAGSAIGTQNSIFMLFLSGSAVAISPLLWILLALVFIVASLAFLSFYGFCNDDGRPATIAGIINAGISMVIFQSILGVFFGFAMLAAAGFVVKLSNTYSRELKRWVRFRSGSNSIGKALLLINLAVSAGLAISLAASQADFRASFREELGKTMESSIGSLEGPSAEIARSQIDKSLDSALNSPFFVSYFRWFPVITALGAFFILEFFRNLVFSNLGGLFTLILLHFKR
jgi:hypothetical protein